MGAFEHLPMLVDRPRQACPKPMPRVLAKQKKAKTKVQQEKDFREAVWLRDHGRSRASGKPLTKSGTTDWKRLGEVHHVLARSTDPDKRLDPSNGILLSKEEHALAGAVCPNDPAHRLLDIEGDVDRSQPQTFIWRDMDGKQLRRSIG